MSYLRLDIKTGYLCNNNCRFCVQAHNKKYGNRTTEEIKESLREALKKGATGVVFTGGEFTIRKDAFELVNYAKELGFEVIQLQSNGRMFSNMNFVKKMIACGANEFGPSLHGYKAEIHDYLTRSEGAWKQTVQGIINIKKMNQKVIINSVVVKPNYRYTPHFAKLCVKLKVDQFQFAFVHAQGNAWNNYEQMMPVMSLAVPYIKRGLQIGIDAGINVMTEAVPYCLMKGYEKYVAELYIPKTIVREYKQWVEDFEKIRKNEGKGLFEQCKECRYRLICEGPWKEYPERMGTDEFKPVKGPLVKDPDEIIFDKENSSHNEKKVVSC